jgi:hypothetical protein
MKGDCPWQTRGTGGLYRRVPVEGLDLRTGNNGQLKAIAERLAN